MDRYAPPTVDHQLDEALAHLDREEHDFNRSADAALAAFCRQHGAKHHDCEILGELGQYGARDSWEVNLRLKGDRDTVLAFIHAMGQPETGGRRA